MTWCSLDVQNVRPRDVDVFLDPVFIPDFFLDLAGSQVILDPEGTCETCRQRG